jgi:hypothetical protein
MSSIDAFVAWMLAGQYYDVRYCRHRSVLSQRLQVIRAFAFPRVVLSPSVLSLEPAIIFRKRLVKQRCILIGKTALANDATDLNQESQFLIL